MVNSWLSRQVMADMKKVYNDLIIINLYEWKPEKLSSSNIGCIG